VGGVPPVFLRVNGRRLKLALMDNRGKNFKTFVKLYFYSGVDGGIDPMHDENMHLPIKLKVNSKGYKAFEMYARTDFGSAVIKEVILNEKIYVKLRVQQARGLQARADRLRIFLPIKFPGRLRFEIGGQKVFDLAIIHHEFSHTMLVRSKAAKKIKIQDELWSVRNAENPIRLKRGGAKYEPRYVYYNGKRTVNIITGEVLPLQWTVNKYDPRIMVKLGHEDAL